jgi:hypothetical protein
VEQPYEYLILHPGDWIFEFFTIIELDENTKRMLIDVKNTSEEQLILDSKLVVNNKSISYYNRYVYNLKIFVNCETFHSRESLKKGQYLCSDCQDENKKGKEKKKYTLFGREVTLARIIVTINNLLHLPSHLLFVPKLGIPSFHRLNGMEKLQLSDFVLTHIDEDSASDNESGEYDNGEMQEVIRSDQFEEEITLDQTEREEIITLQEKDNMEFMEILPTSTSLFVGESRRLIESEEFFDVPLTTSAVNKENLNPNTNMKKRKNSNGTTDKQIKEIKDMLEVWRKNVDNLEDVKWRLDNFLQKSKDWKNKCK